jgi:HEAT repeat protein
VKRALTWSVAVVLLAALGYGLAWYFAPDRVPRFATTSTTTPASEEPEDIWLEHLFSQNSQDAEAAAKYVVELGEDALPIIGKTLRAPDEDRERRKAALRACALLGPVARPMMRDVARYLLQEDLSATAGMALSFMGPDALAPLVDGLASPSAEVRRESLRSIGKLRERAPLDANAVVPLLIGGTSDRDPTVRAMGATYLGIVHDRAEESIRALLDALGDPDPTVRLAAANALAEFGETAGVAADALRKASGDKDPEVAREAGRALVMVASASVR